MAGGKDQDFLEFVLDQLAALRAVTPRRMFGGIGLYREHTFFAIIDDGRLYFVTDEATRVEYLERGMKPFQYAPGRFIHTYYEVPIDVLEDDRALCDWASAAVGAQGRRQSKPAGARKARRSPRKSKRPARAKGKSR
jgi:DNA transformation protein